MTTAALVRQIREGAGLSLRALSQAAGVATSTIHRIEKGEMQPTVDTLERIAEAAGTRVHLDTRVDYAASLVGLARSAQDAIRADRPDDVVRMAAEFRTRFFDQDPVTQRRMIAAEPPPTGDARWDAFLGGLAEWLAVQVGLDTPSWTSKAARFLDRGWWTSSIKGLEAWVYAGTPVSFQTRGVYVHRESLTNL